MATVVVGFPTQAVADHHSKDISGHVVKSEFQECMWMHAHISKPSNNVNEFRFRPFIASRATMDHGVKAFKSRILMGLGGLPLRLPSPAPQWSEPMTTSRPRPPSTR